MGRHVFRRVLDKREVTVMALSILVPHCALGGTHYLQGFLQTLASQTVKPHEIIVVDDSSIHDRDSVRNLCQEYDCKLIELPFVNYRPQWSKKFNLAFEQITGDAVMLLSAGFLMHRVALEVMEVALRSLGRGNIVVSDSQRQQMDDAGGNPKDWYQQTVYEVAKEDGVPYIVSLLGPYLVFRETNYMLIDCGFFQALHAVDWIPWDEEFDEVGAWHAIVEWGYRLIKVHKKQLWIHRSLLAWHQPVHIGGPSRSEAQIKASQQLLLEKVPKC
uniref:Putative glycosyltransferase n=1 Tax=viral metagenome TaxID=1070528 RepID=A0A6M3XDT2_9ZZZZ